MRVIHFYIINCLFFATFGANAQSQPPTLNEINSLERLNRHNRLTPETNCKVFPGGLTSEISEDKGALDPKLWRLSGFSEVSASDVPGSELYSTAANSETRYFDLTTLVLKNTNFRPEDAKFAIQYAARVFDKCNVRIRKARIFSALAPNNYNTYNTADHQSLENILRKAPINHRPLILMGKKLIRQKHPDDIATSHYHLSKTQESVFRGVAFVTEDSYFLRTAAKAPSMKTSVEAHELLHLFADMDHCGGGEADCKEPHKTNLMTPGRTSEKENDNIPEDICERLRDSPYISGQP